MLREVSSVEPSTYEQQQQADAAGVRSVAGFIAEISDRSSSMFVYTLQAQHILATSKNAQSTCSMFG